jgi:hypothetical protein
MKLRHRGGSSVRSGADSSAPTKACASRQGRRGVGLTLSSYRLLLPCQQKKNALRRRARPSAAKEPRGHRRIRTTRAVDSREPPGRGVTRPTIRKTGEEGPGGRGGASPGGSLTGISGLSLRRAVARARRPGTAPRRAVGTDPSAPRRRGGASHRLPDEFSGSSGGRMLSDDGDSSLELVPWMNCFRPVRSAVHAVIWTAENDNAEITKIYLMNDYYSLA